ncbi:hypothetical protein J7L18_07640 [Candidatus Bathyarchaeota archaeon]|nr:hypothetical protein [Candidatus Bathyarchaeota archaeon]
MSSYIRLMKDFFQKINPLNPLHYYGYKHIVRGEDARSEEGEIISPGRQKNKPIKKY